MLSLLGIRRGEARACGLAMLFFFLILALYYLIRPVRDQLSGLNGLSDLPKFFLAVLICMLLLTPVYGWMVARLPRSRFIPLVYSFFIVCLCLYALWFMQGAESSLLATSFFVWVSVFNLFVVAVFWSFMADLFSVEQAERLFPLIAFGGSMGSLTGPLLTKTLVLEIGIGPLLLVAAGMLLLALLCALALMRLAPTAATTAAAASQADKAIGGGFLAGARLVFTNKVIASMAVLMMLSDCIGGVLYALVAEHVRSLELDAAQRTAFFGDLDLKTNLIVAGLQLFVARPLLRTFGAGGSFAIALSLNFMVVVWLGLMAVPAFAAIALMTTRACAYGLQKPLLDGFYTRVDRESRYKAKAFIDTAVWRFGDLVTVVGMNGLALAGLVTLSKLGITVYSGACALAAASSGLLGWKVDRWTRAETPQQHQVKNQPRTS